MINRIIENWLTNSNEIGYQVPFTQLLIADGYKVLHRTRHGPFEQGKDVLAVAPDNIPCAFQLKAGNITLKVWREIRGEVAELVELPIIHPSLKKGSPHRPYLVTNGELSEEVRREIDDRNKIWESKGLEPLQTRVKGELMMNFQSVYGDFFPSDVPDLSQFLNLYQEKDNAPLNKKGVSELIESILPVRIETPEGIKKLEAIRAINASVLIVSYILSNKLKRENHIAVIDGWVMLLAYIFALVERFGLEKEEFGQTVELIFSAIEDQFRGLIEEIEGRTNYVEGNPLNDVVVYKPRITLLSGYLSAFGLYGHLRGEPVVEKNIATFLDANAKQIRFICEAMTPFLLNEVFFLRTVGDKLHFRELLSVLLQKILIENRLFAPEGEGNGLPDPYHDVEESIRWLLQMSDVDGETFRGVSYSMKSIILLHARHGMKAELERDWRKICDIQYAEFIPDEKWQIFLWEANQGSFETRFPQQAQSWKSLSEEATRDYKGSLPQVLSMYPEFIPLFLNVYPHRLRPNISMFLDSHL